MNHKLHAALLSDTVPFAELLAKYESSFDEADAELGLAHTASGEIPYWYVRTTTSGSQTAS
jgi:hypothetical protein